jgi:hypothetical protein
LGLDQVAGGECVRIFISYPISVEDPLVSELKGALREDGHEVFEPGAASDYRLPIGELREEISAAIRRSDAVIALLTTPSHGVYFELGLATGAHVPLLVASPSTDGMPADVMSVPYVQIVGDIAQDIAAIKRGIGEIAATTDPSPTPMHETAEAALMEAARDVGVLERLSPKDFEGLVARLFSERGFAVRSEDRNRDVGIDFVLGADSATLVEIKRYSRQNLVSVGAVQKLLGTLVLTGADQAILISSSGFTNAAQALASGTPVNLMTLEDLLALESEPGGGPVVAADLAVSVVAQPGGEPYADVLMWEGSRLPVTVTRKYTTVMDNQSDVRIELLQRSGRGIGSDLADFQLLAHTEIRLPLGVACGTQVEVTATADVAGALRVAASILGVDGYLDVDLRAAFPGSAVGVAIRPGSA